MMMKALCSILLLGCSAALAQQADESLTFDAATIKPATLPVPNGRGPVFLRGPSGGPGTKDPGRINYPYMPLKNLLMTAYDVKNFQISGPGWLDTERFEINAVMAPETTKEQFKVMLRNLLAERFKLRIHRETKELPTYALLVNKGGPKLKESPLAAAPAEDAPLPPPPSGPPKIGPDGFPEFPAAMAGRGGIFTMMMPGRARFVAHQQTMQDLANRLTLQMDRPVTDATGLTAKYDFILTFSTEGLNGVGPLGPLPPPPPPPAGGGGRGNDNVFVPDGETPMTLFGAVQAQLGLKLEAKKGNVEIIVVEHIERNPTEN
jgi:uncharacterized protein (TIGR03435 family)